MKCPESMEELKELERDLPLCKITLYEQAQARLKKNPGKSERQIEREIAEEIERPESTIHTAVQREKKARLDSVKPPTLTESDKVAVIKHAKNIKKDRRTQRQTEREAQKQEIIQKNPPLDNQDYRLIHKDFRETEIEPQSIDALITDPPYGFDYLPLYKDLSEYAKRVLKPDAPCLVMCGQSWLEMVLKLLSSELNYVWTLAYFSPGKSTQVFGRKIKSNWKPVIFLVNGKNQGEHIGDYINSGKYDKEYHDWGQTEEGMSQLIERFTVKGDVILDPFCGAGTTGVAALRGERFFIGIDNDEYSIKQSGERLANASRGNLQHEG